MSYASSADLWSVISFVSTWTLTSSVYGIWKVTSTASLNDKKQISICIVWIWCFWISSG